MLKGIHSITHLLSRDTMPTKPQSQTSPRAQLLHTNPLSLSTYEDFYKRLHAHPELSLHESETASAIANHQSLQAYTVHTSIGGHGVAGVLSNGKDPTILLRADMDALPVQEKTGLDYASKVTVKNSENGDATPVMHACGHDMHVACLLAAAEWLASENVRKNWSGTLVVVFQPNEERGEGARAMVDAGLYEKVPVPDVMLAQHVMPLRTGTVAVREGTMVAAADSFEVKLFGRGGHGSMPHLCVDPVVLAASIVMRLQGIVAREVNPQDPAVLTVGSIQAGQTENVIADEAILKIDIRSQRAETRTRLLEAMRRIIEKVRLAFDRIMLFGLVTQKGRTLYLLPITRHGLQVLRSTRRLTMRNIKECETSGCPRPPIIKQTRKFPLTVNDKSVARHLMEAFKETFGDQFDSTVPPANASEDFSDLATSVDKPYCFWLFGGVEGDKWDKAESEGRIADDIPANHSSLFAPAIQPTLETGVKALIVAALAWLLQH